MPVYGRKPQRSWNGKNPAQSDRSLHKPGDLTRKLFTGTVFYMVDNNKDSGILDLLDEEDYNTILAPDIEFNGLIEFSEPFMIKGRVSGKINATSDLLVDTGAVVHADIKADRVVIKGTVTGNVTADKIVHVFSSGKLTGDVTAPEVVLDTGCFFSGVCTMDMNRGQAE